MNFLNKLYRKIQEINILIINVYKFFNFFFKKIIDKKINKNGTILIEGMGQSSYWVRR